MINLDLDRITRACADDGFDAGIRIVTELEPIGGPGAPVKPATYSGGAVQRGRRWDPEHPDAETPAEIVVIDNVPSQANRLEAGLLAGRSEVGLPEIVLDLSSLQTLPPHLPRQLSSWQFPHRNADAYLRDAELDGVSFGRTEVGRAIQRATPWDAGPLLAWFPQALLYGFWQSHLGKANSQAKHARVWSSRIVGWYPAVASDDDIDYTRTNGTKGDPLNISKDVEVYVDEDDTTTWSLATEKGRKKSRPSEIGMGQVPTEASKRPLEPISFRRITQEEALALPHLRRVSLGGGAGTDAAARALLVALGLHAHVVAFGRGFALRSECTLRPVGGTVTWLGETGNEDQSVADLTSEDTDRLLSEAIDQAREDGVPLEGWDADPLVLQPSEKLAQVIRSTWPALED